EESETIGARCWRRAGNGAAPGLGVAPRIVRAARMIIGRSGQEDCGAVAGGVGGPIDEGAGCRAQVERERGPGICGIDRGDAATLCDGRNTADVDTGQIDIIRGGKSGTASTGAQSRYCRSESIKLIARYR